MEERVFKSSTPNLLLKYQQSDSYPAPNSPGNKRKRRTKAQLEMNTVPDISSKTKKESKKQVPDLKIVSNTLKACSSLSGLV